MDLSWDIVVWTNENTIDYIPSSWANPDKTEYKYPKTNSSFKTKKMIDLCSALNDGFIWLQAKCKAEFVKDLMLAKEMCERGQYTSNLEVTDTEQYRGSRVTSLKRKVKKNQYFNASSSSDSEDVQKVTKRKQSSTFVRDTFETPPSQLATTTNTGHNEPVVNCNTPTTVSGLGTHDNLIRISARANTNQVNVPSTHSDPKTTTATSSNDLILKELFEIKVGILENRKIMERIEAKLGGSNNLLVDITDETIKLPCETQEDIIALEREIQVNKCMKDLITTLYLVGGSTPHKTVYLIMNKIFGRHLAIQYSGQGKKKKSSFSDHLKIYEAVKVATRKRHPSVSEEEIKKSIGLFLSTAKSRLPKLASDTERHVHLMINEEII